MFFLFQIKNAAGDDDDNKQVPYLDSIIYVVLIGIHTHFIVLCVLSGHFRGNFQKPRRGYPVVCLPHIKNVAVRPNAST